MMIYRRGALTQHFTGLYVNKSSGNIHVYNDGLFVIGFYPVFNYFWIDQPTDGITMDQEKAIKLYPNETSQIMAYILGGKNE